MVTYTVTTTSDVVDPSDGELSLREALALADSDPTTADTILFSDAVQGGTIVLAGSQLTVASDVTIDGGAGVTIDAQQASRVLVATPGTIGPNTGIVDVSLNNLIITGGSEGGVYGSALPGLMTLGAHIAKLYSSGKVPARRDSASWLG
jgi:hypothetical protein